MKTNIELKNAKLRFFKGARSLDLNFNHVTNIKGTNETLKTTLNDAYCWVLFDKNSEGQSDSTFAIKTTENGIVIPKIDHSVELSMNVNGQVIVLKKILKEKWVKKKGALITEFNGNTKDYFFNNVPKTKSEYNQKIREIIDETVFLLLSNPLAFNSGAWGDRKLPMWKNRRNLLLSISKEISDETLAKGNKDFEFLLTKLSNKTLDEYKKELASNRKLLKDAILHIPSRIDEVIKNKPLNQNWDDLNKAITEVDKKIGYIDQKIQNRNKAMEAENNAKQELANEIFKLNTRNQNIEFEVKQKINLNNATKVDPLAQLNSQLEHQKVVQTNNANTRLHLISSLESQQSELKNLSIKVIQKREEWNTENAKELKFEDGSFNCPSCKRPLEAKDIESEKEKMKADFISDKTRSLELIHKEGSRLAKREGELKESIETLKTRIENANEVISKHNADIDKLAKEIENIPQVSKLTADMQFQADIDNNKEYKSNKATIAEKEEALANRPVFNVDDLKSQKAPLEKEKEELKTTLNDKKIIEKADTRIAELENEEKDYAQQIANIEKEQFVAQNFTNTKITSLEQNINAMFKHVNFKMFNQQVNGGIEETCIAQYKNVDFNDVNTAGKIQMGLDIINTLSDHFNISVPIFIDNAEGIVNIPETDSQQIRLIVSESHKELTVI